MFGWFSVSDFKVFELVLLLWMRWTRNWNLGFCGLFIRQRVSTTSAFKFYIYIYRNSTVLVLQFYYPSQVQARLSFLFLFLFQVLHIEVDWPISTIKLLSYSETLIILVWTRPSIFFTKIMQSCLLKYFKFVMSGGGLE